MKVEPLCELLFNANDGLNLYCAQQYCDSWINARSYALMIVIGILLLQLAALFWQHRKLKKKIGLQSNARILLQELKK